MKMIETYRGVVYPHHIDHMGHMNVQWYVSKFDQAAWHMMAAVGITVEHMEANNTGMAALEQTIRYKAEVVSGDLLLIKSTVNSITHKVINGRHVMYNATTMKEVASMDFVAVHLDRKLRKSCPFPAEIIDRCNELFNLIQSK